MIWVVSLSTTKLSPRRLTHAHHVLAFAVYLSLVTSTWPLAHAELYLQNTIPVAAPQCISGRTSYLHVRLEFLLYPQLIPQFCNTGGFEPRRTFTSASLWPWIAHMVSGGIAATYGSCKPTVALFRLGFPQAPELCRSLTRNVDALAGSFYKRHAISPDLLVQEWPLTAGEYVVSGSLSSPSRGAFHLSLTVLVHYRSLLVLSLGGWSPQLPTRFLVSRGTQDTHRNASSCLTGLSPALVVLSSTFRSSIHSCCGSYNPTRSNDQMVWAPPVSLATTPGISIDFFSSGY